MSERDDSAPATSGHTTHPDVVGLLTGEMAPPARRDAREHVLACDDCRVEFVDLAVVLGEMRDAARHAPAEPADVPATPVVTTPGSADAEADVAAARSARRRSRRPVRRLAVAGALAACLLAAGGIGAVIGHAGGRTSTRPAAEVVLTAVGPDATTATGSAFMTGSGAHQIMNVYAFGLPNLPVQDHFEVWLLDTRTGSALAIGPISAGSSAHATFAAPATVVARFDAVDVSVQRPADGSRHSAHSVLRGSLA